MTTAKVLIPITDKNGVQTARWMNTGGNSPDRSQAISAPSTAVTESVMVAPETVTIKDSQGVMHTVPTNRWTIETEEVYQAGQCPALAVALKDWYPDATIKAMTNMSGHILVHVWLEEDGWMTDAAGYAHFEEEEYIEEMYAVWGTPEIVEHTPESLKAWMEQMSPGGQNWEAAEWMCSAWMAEHDSL